MTKIAVISVDGHVRGSRAQYRDYVEKKYLDAYDDHVRVAETAGVPDAGNLHPNHEPAVQWDSDLRIKKLEEAGVVAEVLFGNGQPFQVNPFDDFARSDDAELLEAGRQAYNRWLVDFCAQVPARRRGQMAMSFKDVDQAVKDIYWAKENGLGGIALPGINPGDRLFYDPVFDPIWAAAEETGLPLSQHGGAGLPKYEPAGFTSILMLFVENAFFSARSLWMLIGGGIFDRFPDLKCSWIETQLHFLVPAIENLDYFMKPDGDWMGFAAMLGRENPMKRDPGDYFGTNVFVGVSPFMSGQIRLPDLLGVDDDGTRLEKGFHIGAAAAMFGVDFPHFETIIDRSMGEVATLATTPGIDERDVERILCTNAAEIFGFDLDALASDIDRVGFEVSDIVENADDIKSDMPAMVTPFG